MSACGYRAQTYHGGLPDDAPCGVTQEHRHCAACGLVLPGAHGELLCVHHTCVYGEEWAIANRLMCDFFHRHIEPARLPAAQRVDECPADPEG